MQEPWFRRGTWGWYVQVGEKQVPLGKHPSDVAPKKGKRGWSPPPEILRTWREVMARLEKPDSGPTDREESEVDFRGLSNRFLASARALVEPQTFDWYKSYLRDFDRNHPGLMAIDITEDLVNQWIALERCRKKRSTGEPGASYFWGKSSRRAAIMILKRVLNWAVTNKHLAKNPITAMKKPRVQERERILTDEDRAKLLGFFPEGDAFRDFLVAAMESGCRPGEIMKVTAADVDLREGIWRMKGKDFNATGRLRTVYLSPRLLDITRRLMAARPSGPLFLNEKGRPWTRHAVANRLRRKKERKNDALAPDIVAYCLRHTFATNALEKGIPDATVAELMGHHGTATLHRSYSKLRKKREHLRNAAAMAAATSPGCPAPNPATGTPGAASSGGPAPSGSSSP